MCRAGCWYRARDGQPLSAHPFPIGDLNPIAEALPEGWYLEVNRFVSMPDDKRWSAYAGTDRVDGEDQRFAFVDEQPTEWEARARLLRAVLKETT